MNIPISFSTDYKKCRYILAEIYKFFKGIIMPAKFFSRFLGLIALVMVLGAIIINFVVAKPMVEYWILLLLPCFAVPILTSVMITKDENL